MSAEKKGLSPLVWVGIGCGGIVVMGVIVMVILSVFAFNKVKEVGEDMKKNPALTTAKVIDALNPEIEIVGNDEENQTVTFRNVKTGEEVTLDLEGIKEGRFGWTTDEGSVKFDANDSDGQMRVTDSQGNQSLAYGTNIKITDWVPVYAKGKSQGVASYNTDEGVGGNYMLETEDAAQTVVDWYKKTLEDDGYDITSSSQTTTGEGSMNMMEAKKGNRTFSFVVNHDNNTGKTKGTMYYMERKSQ